MRIVTVILNWNRGADTIACIASVRAMTCPSEILVVDNGSTDDSITVIRAAFPDVTIFPTRSNLGYAAGNNAGFAFVRRTMDADAILLLNNDTIAEPEMLAHLVAEYHAQDGNAVIGPEVRYADARDTVWCAGGTIDWRRGYTTNLGIGTQPPPGVRLPTDVPFIVGCAMLIPITVLESAGQFDPGYFMYWEEVEWCVRVRAAGYRLRVIPAAVLYHKVPLGDVPPTPRVLYYLTRNRLLLLRTHLPLHRQFISLPWTLWGLFRTALSLLREHDWQREHALLAGIWDAACGRTGACRIVW